MKAVLISVAAALAAQFVSFPFLIGARSGTDALGWNLIFGIVLAIPSAIVYGLLFTALHLAKLPPWLTIAVSAIVPAAAVLMVMSSNQGWSALSTNNQVLVIAIIGGLVGGFILTRA